MKIVLMEIIYHYVQLLILITVNIHNANNFRFFSSMYSAIYFLNPFGTNQRNLSRLGESFVSLSGNFCVLLHPIFFT